jgi:hypothetical protein
MQQVKFSTVVAILVTGVLLGAAVNAMLNVGDKYKGEIFVDSEDILEFEGLAGEKINVNVKPDKGSDLLATISVTDPDGAMIASETATKKKVAIKKLELPTTGVYQIHVSGANGTIGAYTLNTGGKIGKDIKQKTNDAGVGPDGDTQDTMFDAKSAVPDPKNPSELKSYLLNGSINAPKKSDAVPFNPTLTGPGTEGSDPVELTGFIEKTKKGGFKIKKLPLPDLGTYVLSVENSGLSGIIKTKLKIKPPKVKKQTIDGSDG